MARLRKVEIPELNYKLKARGDGSLNSRRLMNLVVADGAVSTKHIASPVLTSGYVWIFVVFFQFFSRNTLFAW